MAELDKDGNPSAHEKQAFITTYSRDKAVGNLPHERHISTTTPVYLPGERRTASDSYPEGVMPSPRWPHPSPAVAPRAWSSCSRRPCCWRCPAKLPPKTSNGPASSIPRAAPSSSISRNPEDLEGDILTGRAAFSLKKGEGQNPTYGVLWYTQRIAIDRDSSTVSAEPRHHEGAAAGDHRCRSGPLREAGRGPGGGLGPVGVRGGAPGRSGRGREGASQRRGDRQHASRDPLP